jgi:hypothetical protein
MTPANDGINTTKQANKQTSKHAKKQRINIE